MCVTCVEDVETTPPPAATYSRGRLAELHAQVRVEALETNRQRPRPWPICLDCGGPIHKADRFELYPQRHSNCGLNRLERLFGKLMKARGRRRRRRAVKRLLRFARTGR
jgi:hypothetical protein